MGKVSKSEIAELLKQKPLVQNRITWDDDVLIDAKNNEPQISSQIINELTTLLAESDSSNAIKNENELPLISKQLVNDKETISKQLVNTIGEQLVNDKETISKQLANNEEAESEYILDNKETISKRISKRNKETISKQLVNGLVNKKHDVSMLVGLQRKILIYIVEDCVYRGQLTSGLITNETFRQLTETDAHSIKTSIQRLIKKNFIQRNPDKKGKRGQGGFSTFSITKEIRESVLQEQRNSSISKPLVNGLVNAISKPLVNNWETHWETNAPSSSSSNNLKTTTTSDLPDDWNFDITSYKRFGFTTTQLKQLASLGVISAADVEQSLIEFSYDLDNNALPPIKTTKINFLMGLLRSGHSYVSEGFKNELQVTISEMARKAEVKRKNLLEEKFIVWEAELSEDERKGIIRKLPPHLMSAYRAYGISSAEVRDWLFDHYSKNCGA